MGTLQESRPNADPKALILPLFVGLGLAVLLVRLWYLQIVRGEELSQQALRGRTISVPIPAPRGPIVDRNGIALAGVRPSLALMVTPSGLLKRPDAIKQIAQICEMDPKDLASEIEENSYRRFLPFVAKVGITNAQAMAIEERRAFFPGVFVRSESVRQYPLHQLAAHIVGYVGLPSKDDVDRLAADHAELPNFVGKVGVERSYDADLVGSSGKESVEVDTRGRQLRPRTSEAPIPGSRITLTLDANLQRVAAQIMAGRKGAVVALDPRNGEVLCMVSSPTYDPNFFAQRGPKDKITAILTNPAQPMHNRAAGSAYAPGSTFKIATLIAGIRKGIVGQGTTFVCNGSIRIGNRTFRCLGHHGRIDWETAIEKSCNVFFAEVGSRVTREGIVEAAQELGLGRKTDIDILGERSGIIPGDEWLESRKLKWYPGDTINLAVGQGYVETTPLQMANYAAIVANSGHAFRPHTVRSLLAPGASSAPQSVPVESAYEIDLDPAWWARIHRALLRVVNSGTGREAQIPGIPVAGKTGSAEHGKGKASHAWFIAYAPADSPRIAIAVVLETAGHGGDIAAPVAKRIMERYLRGPSMPSSLDSERAAPASSPKVR
jgi:penicillin-binding protein 2